MTEKKSTHKPAATEDSNSKPQKRRKPRAKRGFFRTVTLDTVAQLVATLVLALASAGILVLVRDPSVLPWSRLVLVVLTIAFGYVALISLQYFFHGDFVLSRRKTLHVALSLLMVVIVTAPVAMVVYLTSAQLQQQKKKLDDEKTTQRAIDSKRIQLYSMVTDSVMRLLRKPNIDSDDLNELLIFCRESLSLNKPTVTSLRVTAAYVNQSETKLIVPKRGYFGTDFDREIEGLYFDISPRGREETFEKYRERLGVAGWSYLERKNVLERDITKDDPARPYVYKQFEALRRGNPDRAMICVCIPDMVEGRENRCVGVLSVSSMTSDVFNDNDLSLARFFATLLGRFKTPIDDPAPKQVSN